LAAVARAIAQKMVAETVGSKLTCYPPTDPNYPKLSYGQGTPLDFTHAYTFPAAIAYLEFEDDPVLARSVEDWLETQVRFATENDLRHGHKTYFNRWSAFAHVSKRTGDTSLLAATRAELDRLTAQTFEHVSPFMGNRVWWMQNVGYVLDALGQAAVAPRPELDSTAGEIQVQASAGGFHVTVNVVNATAGHGLRTDPPSFDRTARLVLYDPSGTLADAHPHPAAAAACTDEDRTWFEGGGWIKTFTLPPSAPAGVYRLRVETDGPPRYLLRLVETTTGNAMYSGGSGDGVSPGWRYPAEVRHWFYVPQGVAQMTFRFRPNPWCHEYGFRAYDANGPALVTYRGQSTTGPVNVADRDPTTGNCPDGVNWRTVTIQPMLTGQWWSVDLGPAFDRLPPNMVDRSSSHELRTFEVEGIPRYFAQSPTGAFQPRLLWPPVPVGPAGSLTASDPTFTWRAEAGADAYEIRLEDSAGVPQVERRDRVQVQCPIGAGLCTVRLGVSLTAGSYQLRVTALSNVPGAGSGPSSQALTFTVP
jgi:hypothetical protein